MTDRNDDSEPKYSRLSEQVSVIVFFAVCALATLVIFVKVLMPVLAGASQQQ